MKKKKNLYGVVNPKLLDYLLAVVLSVMAVSALWVGIWIAATQSFESAKAAFELIGKSLMFELGDANYWIVLLGSVVFYGAAFSCVVMLLMSLIRKRYRVVPGVLSILLAGFTLCVEVAFVGVYANVEASGVVGVFAIILAVLAAGLLELVYKVGKYSARLVVSNELYSAYLDELGKEGLLKEKEREIVGLSKSQAVYDAIYSNDEELEEVEEIQEVEDEQPEEPVVEEKPKAKKEEQPKELVEEGGMFGLKANHYTFEKKLKIAKPIARQYFKEIKKYYEEIGFKSNLTKSAETFTYKNQKYAIITTAGKSGLKIYFRLSPADYEGSTLPFTDVSDKKKYEKTPLLFVVKSDLAVRRAKALMDEIKKALENENK